MDLQELKAQHPEIYKAVLDEGKALGVAEGKAAGIEEGKAAGRTEGAEAERNRIQGIMSIKAPGAAAIVADQAFVPTATKESVAVLVLEAQGKNAAAFAAALREDAEATTAAAAGVGTTAPETAASAQDQAVVAAMVAGGNAVRK